MAETARQGAFTLKTEVLKIDDKDVFRCKTVDLSDNQEGQVHPYILSRQKQEIAQRKGRGL